MIRRLPPVALVTGLSAGLLALALLTVAARLAARSEQSSYGCGQSPALGEATASPTALAEIPAPLIGLYRQAAADYGLGPDGWAWLAAVNRIETDFGRDLSTSTAGAVGWMQFEPATWSEFGVDANGDGRKDPYDPADAIAAAARYLRSLGAPANWQVALRAYNGGPALAGSPGTLAYWQTAARSAAAYIGTTVPGGQPPAVAAGACLPCPAPDRAWGQGGPRQTGATGVFGEGAVAAEQCAGGGAVPLAPGDRAQLAPDGRARAPAGAPPAVRAMIVAGNQLIGKPYVYGGGHADFGLAGGYDCSSSVSWALHGAGLLSAPEDSTALEGFGDPGAGLWVTVYANPGHAFVYIAGIRLDTSPQAGDGRFSQFGPRWRPATRTTAGFVARHPMGL